MVHILSECCEVDERRPLLHDEAVGEGNPYLHTLTICFIDSINVI